MSCFRPAAPGNDRLAGASSPRDGIHAETLNIVLIGMPGAGKSCIGQTIADITGRPFLDTDDRIEAEAGMSIPEIFCAEGEAGFRARERALIAGTAGLTGCVIAVGGGAVLDRRNLVPLRRNGWICHIERDCSLLSREGRPLSRSADLYEMYRVRLPFYMSFRDCVVRNDRSIADAANDVRKAFLARAGRVDPFA